MKFYANGLVSDTLPDRNRQERERYPDRKRCGTLSPDKIYVCTRPAHSKFTVHLAGNGVEIAAAWWGK